jgi:hypothetical protein
MLSSGAGTAYPSGAPKVEETRVPGENHQPVGSHRQALSQSGEMA